MRTMDDYEIVEKLLDLLDWTVSDPVYSARILYRDQGKETTYFLASKSEDRERFISDLFGLNVACQNIIGFGLERKYNHTGLWIRFEPSKDGDSNLTWIVVHAIMELIGVKAPIDTK